MASGQKPDYLVKLPVAGVWHRLGAAWKNTSERESINVVIDVGCPITLQPGTKLVLMAPKEDEREPGQ